MKQEFLNLEIKTNGQKFYVLTDKICGWIKKNKFNNGKPKWDYILLNDNTCSPC